MGRLPRCDPANGDPRSRTAAQSLRPGQLIPRACTRRRQVPAGHLRPGPCRHLAL